MSDRQVNQSLRRTGKLTRKIITQTALAIIDEEGLENLNIEQLAVRLDVRGASLYYHFESKADILAEVVRLIIAGTIVPPKTQNTDWREWLVVYSLNGRRAILRHPNAVSLLFGFYPYELWAASYERTSLYLQQAGVPLQLHVLIFEGLYTITYGSALRAGGRQVVKKASNARHAVMTQARKANLWKKEEQLFTAMIRSFLRGLNIGAAASS